MATVRGSVRGAGTDRWGATDTAVLLWKVINANPEITREKLFEIVEHDIPSGWAIRRYLAARRVQPANTGKARWYVLRESLVSMVKSGSIRRVGDPPRYVAIRPIKNYKGDQRLIDETQTVAAEHLNFAYALRVAERWVTRGSRACSADELEAVYKVIRMARRGNGGDIVTPSLPLEG